MIFQSFPLALKFGCKGTEKIAHMQEKAQKKEPRRALNRYEKKIPPLISILVPVM